MLDRYENVTRYVRVTSCDHFHEIVISVYKSLISRKCQARSAVSLYYVYITLFSIPSSRGLGASTRPPGRINTATTNTSVYTNTKDRTAKMITEAKAIATSIKQLAVLTLRGRLLEHCSGPTVPQLPQLHKHSIVRFGLIQSTWSHQLI